MLDYVESGFVFDPIHDITQLGSIIILNRGFPFHSLFPNKGLERFYYLWKLFILDYVES